MNQCSITVFLFEPVDWEYKIAKMVFAIVKINYTAQYDLFTVKL